MSEAFHIPVLLHESVDALLVDRTGVFVDVTFGGGGHSRLILDKINGDSRLLAFDRDPIVQQHLPDDARFTLIPWNYRHLKKMLRAAGVTGVQGILADLGVSSHQFDAGERGFSFRTDAPLDMRMNTEAPFHAGHLLAEASAPALQQIFSEYAELRNARQLAMEIVATRQMKPLRTTGDLMAVAEKVMKGERHKYLAQVFQALRIAVNDELTSLKEMLSDAADVLLPGGRLVVITYHSLEDRLVKAAFRNEAARDDVTNMTGQRKELYRVITKKPILPGREEMRINSRATSAKLRVAERI